MSTSAQMFLFFVVILQICNAQMNPFLNLFANGNIGQLTQMATRLAASAAEHTFAAQKETFMNPGRPEPRPLTLNSRPSEFIGQSLTNAISPTVSKLDEMSLPSQLVETKSSPSTFRNGGANSLIELANAFLGGSKRTPSPPGSAFGTKQFPYSDKILEVDDPFPTIRQIAPGANNNFGMPKGEGCLPFLSEFMRVAYGNCVKEADERTWDVWGSQITNALSGRKIDFLKASKETCKRGAERQQCGQLRKVISECDILGSLQVGMQLQRAIQRCDEISGIIDQNPVQVLDQVNSMIGGEFAQGFLHKFLG